MATKQQVTKQLARIGATLTDDIGEWHVYYLDAPAGMRWHTGTHTITAEYYPAHESKADLWDDLLADATAPLEPCDGWQDGLPELGPCERCTSDGII
jgi:hypothetical protein